MLSQLTTLRQDFGYLPVVDSIDEYNLTQTGIFYLDRCLRYLRRPQLLFNDKPFVFGIGLGKTGTSSLTAALNLLGYNSQHWDYPKAMLKYKSGKLFVNCNKLLVGFNAYTDTPVARVYKLLASAFPQSKFILTIRDEQSWFESHARWVGPSGKDHFTKGITEHLRLELYGSFTPDPDKNIAKFRQHNESVREFFQNRPNDLLVMNIVAGEGWEKLCPFLGEQIPDLPFPHSNLSPNKR